MAVFYTGLLNCANRIDRTQKTFEVYETSKVWWLITMVYNAVKAGAVGCAVGRNIWGAPDPAKMCAALAAVIHGGASVAEAMKLLR